MYKSIAYEYPTSQRAARLGMEETGCYFVQRRDGQITFVDSDCEGFATPDDKDLIALYMETEGEACPMFLEYGNKKALRAICS